MTRRYWLSIGFAVLLITACEPPQDAEELKLMKAEEAQERLRWEALTDCIQRASKQHRFTTMAYEEAERKCRDDYYGANR